MQRRTALSVSTLIVATALALGPAHQAAAVDNGSWSVAPTSAGGGPLPRTNFTVDLAAGKTIQDSVTIQNLSDTDIKFQIYAADAFNPTSGGLGVQGPDAPHSGASSWIVLPVSSWTLPAHNKLDVPFVIKVPDNATPGDHAAGIAALNTAKAVDPAASKSNVQIAVQRAVAVPVFVRVTGALNPSLNISKVAVDHSSSALPGMSQKTKLALTITNDGNVRLSPKVEAKLTSLLGSSHTFDPKPLNSLLPGSSVTVQMSTDVGPIIGPGKISLKVTAENFTTSRSTTFWNLPWTVIVAALLAIALYVAYRVRRRRDTNKIDLTGEPADEDLAVASS
jgi:hypothetical protein